MTDVVADVGPVPEPKSNVELALDLARGVDRGVLDTLRALPASMLEQAPEAPPGSKLAASLRPGDRIVVEAVIVETRHGADGVTLVLNNGSTRVERFDAAVRVE